MCEPCMRAVLCRREEVCMASRTQSHPHRRARPPLRTQNQEPGNIHKGQDMVTCMWSRAHAVQWRTHPFFVLALDHSFHEQNAFSTRPGQHGGAEDEGGVDHGHLHMRCVMPFAEVTATLDQLLVGGNGVLREREFTWVECSFGGEGYAWHETDASVSVCQG